MYEKKKSEPTLFVFLFAWTLINKIWLIITKKFHLHKKAAIPHMQHVCSCVHARVHYSTDVKRNRKKKTTCHLLVDVSSIATAVLIECFLGN